MPPCAAYLMHGYLVDILCGLDLRSRQTQEVALAELVRQS
jgi:hypothetical protein